jgi:LysR family transcriptional regulator, benzoate and cis,cis-muconate-responsive activator of ben and cat genes
MSQDQASRIPSTGESYAGVPYQAVDPAVVLAGGIEIRLLEVFVAVAEELHFGRAAKRLGLAQPPVSRSIQTLEARLGLRLLERSTRAVQLTGGGEVLLTSSRALLRQHQRLLSEMSLLRLNASVEPIVSVAYDPGIAGGLTNAALRHFAASFPTSRVQLTSISHGADGAAASLEADLALVCGDSTGDRGVERYVVCSEEIGAVVAARHSFGEAASVTLRELAREPQLEALSGSEHWRARLSVGGLTGLTLGCAAGYDKFVDGLDLVAAGAGVLLAPRLAWESFRRDDLDWIPVRDAGTVTLMVAWRPGRLSRPAQSFAKFIVESARLRRVASRQGTTSSPDNSFGSPGAASATA